MPTLLVTGGAGYIGSHFCKIAKRNGFEVVVYDNLSTGNRNFVKWGDLVVADLHDYFSLVETMQKYQPLAVIHFAASIEVGESVTNPAKYYDNNVISTLNVLRAMLACKVKHIIFSSTSATYGIPDNASIGEDTPQKPINPYGASKLMVEQILADFSHAYELDYTALRYFNASGGDPEGELGETHQPSNHLIPIVLESVLYPERKLKVFGGDWHTPDGSCIRDYIHVNDLATAHLLALHKLQQTGQSKCINLGIGKGFSVLEIIKAAEEVTGHKISYEVVGRRAGDPEALICDNTLAKQYLGWQPQYLDVHEHVLHTWNWLQKYKPAGTC